jgi:glycine/D-amino acid oxidase-like deaminating enzyme
LNVGSQRVRIVGAGLAGVALADALMELGVRCQLIDQTGIAAGASGAASGLLHPLPGLRAQPGWRAREAFEEAVESVQRRSLLQPQIIGARGVFRPASHSQRKDFLRAAREGWAEWCLAGPPVPVPQVLAREGLWIEQGLVVDVPLYLKTWVEELQQRGLELQVGQKQPAPEGSESQAKHSGGITTVWCTGIDVQRLLHVPCEIVRGQALVVRPTGEPLTCGIAGRAYVAPMKDHWVVGATFEHGAVDREGDAELARRLLRARVEELWPGGDLLDQPLLHLHVGHRLSTPDHMPLCGTLPNGDWVIAGLGSKGLLHHVLLAREVARALVAGQPDRLPMEIALARLSGTSEVRKP